MNRDRTIITVSMVVIGLVVVAAQTQWARKAIAYVTAFSHGGASAGLRPEVPPPGKSGAAGGGKPF